MKLHPENNKGQLVFIHRNAQQQPWFMKYYDYLTRIHKPTGENKR